MTKDVRKTDIFLADVNNYLVLLAETNKIIDISNFKFQSFRFLHIRRLERLR